MQRFLSKARSGSREHSQNTQFDGDWFAKRLASPALLADGKVHAAGFFVKTVGIVRFYPRSHR
jgi:hypothetical protein